MRRIRIRLFGDRPLDFRIVRPVGTQLVRIQALPATPPAVSAILLSYDCKTFAAEALRSVLAQDHSEPMEILVSDDASTDGTDDVLRAEIAKYRGPRHVRFVRQPTNSGSKSAHLNRVISLTSGGILVSFDCDDVSEPERVRRIVEVFRRSPVVQAVYSEFIRIDPAGRVLGPGRVPHPPEGTPSRVWFARADAYASGATLAVRRSVFDVFGALDPDIHEDIVLPFRASLLGEVGFISDPLVRARRHAGSLTADMWAFVSLSAYRTRMELGIERTRRNGDSRMVDIAAAEALFPGRTRDFEHLRTIVRESLVSAELTGKLLSRSFMARVAALLRLTGRGAYREDLLRHTALVLAPRAYLRYKRGRFGIPT
jgi:glycosyltransferase involved in cell wall biosynthesis